MIFNFYKKIINDIYDINFQSNDRFYKIRTRYNIIHDWFIMDNLMNGFSTGCIMLCFHINKNDNNNREMLNSVTLIKYVNKRILF
jgi:hypothetical protein